MGKGYQEAIVQECLQLNENSGIYVLSLLSDFKGIFLPGQFVMLKAKASGSKLSRPFTVYKTFNQEVVAIVFEVVGNNTRAYSMLKNGEAINFLGPLGKSVPLNPETNNFTLVGGGTGAASLMQVSEALNKPQIKVNVFLGAYDEFQIFGVEHFKRNGCETEIITDIGPGHQGLVTDLLEKHLTEEATQSTIIACGPVLMLKKVHELAIEYGNECFVLLEEMMACGYGSCKSCVVFGFDENGKEEVKHVCEDGPAFESRWINWDKLVPPVTTITRPQSEKTDKPMLTALGPFGFESPIINASGCLDLRGILLGIVDISCLGALVSKGIEILPRTGNPAPRIVETPNGLMNAIGLEGVGIDEFIKIYLPQWLSLGKPFIANISGKSMAEYVELARRLTSNEVKIIEINISCPNISEGGIVFGISPQMAFDVVHAVRQVTDAILITKLTPEAPNIVTIAERVVAAGTDAISMINTLTGLVIDTHSLKPLIGNVTGGMSGPGIRPRAVKLVRDVYSANLGVPIIGMGGIEDGDSAFQFMVAGSSLIAVGTELLVNPDVATEIHDGLEKIRQFHGVNHIQDLVGSLIT